MKKSILLLLFTSGGLLGQGAQPFATGLSNPSKILLTPGGNLLVCETGSTPNSGRVSLVNKNGARQTLVDGLPSGLAAPNNEADGPDGLALRGNTLFVDIGEGDSFVNGAKANTIQPNPAGPSSPLFASILRLTLPSPVDTMTTSFSMAAKDQSTVADGNTASLTDSAGNTMRVELLAQFRSGMADPVTAWRNSHPYGIALHEGRPDMLYVVDAGMNSLVEVTLSTGRARTLVHFAPLPNPTPMGGPFIEAVPDSVRPYDSQLLVTFLTGFPFVPGGSQAVTVDPATGTVTPFITSLSSATDIAYVPRASARALFFTLEYSAAQLAGAPGRLTRYDTQAGTVLAANLKGPTSMAYDGASGIVYVANHDDGTIMKVTGQ